MYQNHTFYLVVFMPAETRNILRSSLRPGKGYFRLNKDVRGGGYYMHMGKCLARVTPLVGFNYGRGNVKRLGKMVNKRFGHYGT